MSLLFFNKLAINYKTSGISLLFKTEFKLPLMLHTFIKIIN